MRIVLVLALWLAGRGAWAETLKVSTWNLDWLTSASRTQARLPADVRTRTPEDFARLAAYAARLNADIVALQEVDGPAAGRIFDPARYRIETIDEDVVQRVGIAVRRDIGIVRHPDVTALDVEPQANFRLRAGLDVTLVLPGGATLRALVVHLKSGCQTDPIAGSSRPSCALLAAQIGPLADWAAARQREGVAFLLMGDFNRVLDTPEELGAALAHAAPLLRATEGFENPCWDGAPFIDHIFAGGPARAWLRPETLRVQLFTEVGADWKQRLSDHCPVSVMLDTGG
jgi:endonuclease/exonuclease/phosphatase family metal-dependent hydrolase